MSARYERRPMIGGVADEDVLLAMGKLIRTVRLRAGLDQRRVAAMAGTSSSTLSRMELGHGGHVPLVTWLDVAEILDLPPLGWAHPEPRFGVAVEHLVERGGWRRSAVHPHGVVLDREPRPIPGLRHVQLPAERAVLLRIAILTDLDAERGRLRRAIADVADQTALDRSVSGVLVIARHGAKTRMAAMHGRSDGRWLMALRDPGMAMPLRPGVVWLAPRGTHLLPGG